MLEKYEPMAEPHYIRLFIKSLRNHTEIQKRLELTPMLEPWKDLDSLIHTAQPVRGVRRLIGRVHLIPRGRKLITGIGITHVVVATLVVVVLVVVVVLILGVTLTMITAASEEAVVVVASVEVAAGADTCLLGVCSVLGTRWSHRTLVTLGHQKVFLTMADVMDR
jgi:hypothetical protein